MSDIGGDAGGAAGGGGAGGGVSSGVLTVNQIVAQLEAQIKQELADDDGEFTEADGVRLVGKIWLLLREFSELTQPEMNQVFEHTYRRVEKLPNLTDTTRAILEGAFASGVAPAVFEVASSLWKMARDAFMKKFDLDGDGKVSAAECGKVLCGPPPIGCCGAKHAQFTEAELAEIARSVPDSTTL